MLHYENHCLNGTRISELKYVTVEPVKEGSTVVWNKGKYRTVYFTDNLRHELLRYCMEIECSAGVIFSGREKGSLIIPGAVWKSLRYIARQEWYIPILSDIYLQKNI